MISNRRKGQDLFCSLPYICFSAHFFAQHIVIDLFGKMKHKLFLEFSVFSATFVFNCLAGSFGLLYFSLRNGLSGLAWCKPVILAFVRLEEGGSLFEACVGSRVRRPC